MVHCKSISVSVKASDGKTVLSSLTNPFRFSSKVFLARILESDKAENLASLLELFVVSGFVICVFSSATTIGLAIATFSILLLMPLLILLVSLVSFLETSTIE
ncbi:MAG TPA: hypothetical protein VFS71_18940 [Flavobacterium sp.]|uniref:hypothetical protein n=1 Tax=Flavobacterium sp. TaxID=239 RepID=UPI002DB98AEA|nr:hypothetical protein [Flavobacterium sp.]HEU4791769.1 hypothetical protein [Flavobacterium sp.]